VRISPKIITIIFLFLAPSTSCAEKCKYSIPLRVDDSFTKWEISALRGAAARWQEASDGKICFKISVVNTNEENSLKDTKKDGLLTVYNGKFKKQMVKETGCGAYSACVVFGYGNSFSSDIFMIKDEYFVTVAIHEMGHLLGIVGHSDDPNDIMFRIASDSQAITDRDKAVINCIIEQKKVLNWANSCSYEGL